ncbi:MAG: hypothetical protein J6T25_01775 [Bacilli bacterium]|nr:hypothetical protein [Bacilli bacterium]
MKLSKVCVLCATLTGLALTSCSANNNPGKRKKDAKEVEVFVLSGQSNMEGSTYWTHPTSNTPLLENYFDENDMDFSTVRDGIDNVLTSYYGFYHPSGWTNAHTASEDKSSPEARLTPNFQPTKVGMGVGDKGDNPNPFFGPELGLAYTISEYVGSGNPVYLIKCAFSGSGFTNGNYANGDPDWDSREDDPRQSLFYLLKTYTHNCLEVIKDAGYAPLIRGFVWHQGESGGGKPDYETSMRKLLADFKTEFEDYALYKDTDNIAFLDCTIYDGKGTSSLSYGTDTNNAKMKIANESEDDLNFCINANHEEGGLGLEIGDDAKGGYNTYHYNTADAFKLGQAYGQLILDNDLLD